MLLFDLARDHLSFGDFVAAHHLRMRKDDARRFMKTHQPDSPAEPYGDGLHQVGKPIAPAQFTGIRVVYDDTLPDNTWRLCPNNRPEAVVAEGQVLADGGEAV